MLTTDIAATDAGQEHVVSFVLTQVGNDQPTTADIIKRGQEALTRLERNSWPDWVDVIRALNAGRTHALQEASTNSTKSHSFHKCMGRWLRIHHFDNLDKGDRSRLLECADNLDAINAWRSNLPRERQLGLNHFRVVLSHWKRSLRPRANTSDDVSSTEKSFPDLVELFDASITAKQSELIAHIGVEQLLGLVSKTMRAELEDRLLAQMSAMSSPKSKKLGNTLGKIIYGASREPDPKKRAEAFEIFVTKYQSSKRANVPFVITFPDGK